MGASASVDLRQEDIAEIEDITVYEPKEIKSLYKRFMRLDAGKKGTLAVEDLLMVPEVSMNPLAGRLTSLFARDADGRINFRSFAAGLSAFSERARTDVRKRAVFRLYDVDGDGYINDADLHAVLRMIAGKAVQPAGVADEVVARTMAAADRDGDGRISFEDFDAVRVRTRAHVCEDGRREQSRARLPRASRARARAPPPGCHPRSFLLARPARACFARAEPGRI
jgi:serine/threonine-protein phosphatase 2B regulatory subunit